MGQFCCMIIGIIRLEPSALKALRCCFLHQWSFNRGRGNVDKGAYLESRVRLGAISSSCKMFLKPQQNAAAQTKSAVEPALQPWVEK